MTGIAVSPSAPCTGIVNTLTTIAMPNNISDLSTEKQTTGL